MHPTKLIFAALVCAGTVAVAHADPTLPAPSTQTGVTYATDIKPIFDVSCVKCHHGDRAKGHLHLDTLAGILKGGKEGPILKAGNSADSFVVKSIAHLSDDQDDWMPPLDNKAGIKPLTTDQIALIRAWIDQGAK